MPFKQDLKNRADQDMTADKDGEASSSTKAMEANAEAEDYEFDSKQKLKEQHPPRFSTLFEVPFKAHTPEAAPPLRDVESYPQQKRKSGVYIPTPVFIILAVLFLFESTVLFAYTIIGLYNNTPTRVLGAMGVSEPLAQTTSCDCTTAQAPINIAPNFIIPQAQQGAEPQLVTITATATPSDTNVHSQTSTLDISSMISAMLPSTTSTSSTTSSSNPTSQAAAVASQLMSIMSTAATSSSSSSTFSDSTNGAVSTTVSIVTPPGSTATSVVLETVNPDTGATESAERSTVTSMTTVVRRAMAPSATFASMAARKEARAVPTDLVELTVEEALEM